MVQQMTAKDAMEFAKVWTYKGVALVIDEAHSQFAADFANVVLRSYMELQARMAQEAKKPKVILAE